MPEQATKMARARQLVTNGPAPEQIAALAYSLWQERGCPEGSPEEDWFRAEEALTTSAERESDDLLGLPAGGEMDRGI